MAVRVVDATASDSGGGVGTALMQLQLQMARWPGVRHLEKKKWSHAQKSPIVVNLSHVAGLSRRKLLSWEVGSGAVSGISVANSKLAGRDAGRRWDDPR